MNDVPLLIDELVSALNEAGDLEKWVQVQFAEHTEAVPLSEAYRSVTRHLLDGETPRTADWERVLVTIAAHSSQWRTPTAAFEASRCAIEELSEMVDAGAFKGTSADRLATLASALTVALAAQGKLRQPIESAVGRMIDKCPVEFHSLAERCQDIWQRRGQMSGTAGLFVWDCRNHEWRFGNDFKPMRPT